MHVKPRPYFHPSLFAFCVLSAALSALCHTQRLDAPDAPLRLTPDGRTWVNQTLARMTLEEKVGQMLQVRVFGDSLDFTDPNFLYVRDEIQKYHIGSLDLSVRMLGPNLVKGSPENVAAILNQLQKDSRLPLLVGGDIERGPASRLSDSPEFPFPMAFGAIDDPAYAEKFGAITAEEARAVGIDWAYAPVADVNSNPDNPIINDRSFGEDPTEVGNLVAAYIRGAHKNGLLVAVKHFPGEGDTDTDPHVRVTRINASLHHLEHVELPPFRKAIAAGADSVMVGQVMVPALDSDPARIATTSPKIVNRLLREKLGFKGVVITDALEMQGLTRLYPGEADPSGRIAVDAVKAGDDVLMLPGDIGAAYDDILAAVKSGEIPESHIDESVRRILTLKAELGLNKDRLVDLGRVRKVFADPNASEFAQQVSDDAVTLVRNNHDVLPLRSALGETGANAPHNRLVVIIVADSRLSRLGPLFESELKLRRPDAIVFHYYNDHIDSDAVPWRVMPAVNAADKVVIAVFETHAQGRQLYFGGMTRNVVGLASGGSEFIDNVLNAKPKKTVVVALGSPYLIEDHPQIDNYICTYSLTPTGEVSAVRALFGEIKNHARLPITLPGVAARGFSLPWPANGARAHVKQLAP